MPIDWIKLFPSSKERVKGDSDRGIQFELGFFFRNQSIIKVAKNPKNSCPNDDFKSSRLPDLQEPDTIPAKRNEK